MGKEKEVNNSVKRKEYQSVAVKDSELQITKKDVKKSVVNVTRKIILGLSIIVFVFCGVYLFNRLIVDRPPDEGDTPTVDHANTQTAVDPSSGEVIQDKYSALLKMNEDFVGKLIIDATGESGINVVQTDNNYTYLNTGFKGETTRYGTLFVDYRNDVRALDTNTIIYGHNMRDGSQLGTLSLYADIENYKDFPIIKFDTIYRNTEWKVFAAFISNGDKAQDNGYEFPYITPNFPSDEKFLEFIDEVKARSYYTNEDVDIVPGDKILTISTCDTVFEDARFVVMARLVRQGESADVDTSKAVKNDNQRFPQAWYDVKGKKNPFKNADKFTIK